MGECNSCDNICARCAAREKGCMDCCTEPFVEGDNGFVITFSDIARISASTGLAPEEFCSVNRLDEAGLAESAEDFLPGLHHKGVWLGMKGEGKCFFLGERGCRIFGARPMMCRVHPFWFETASDGTFKLILDRSPGPDRRLCVVGDMSRSDERVAEMLSGSIDEVARDLEQFASEAKENGKYLPLVENMSVSSVMRLIEQESRESQKKPILVKAVAVIPDQQHKQE